MRIVIKIIALLFLPLPLAVFILSLNDGMRISLNVMKTRPDTYIIAANRILDSIGPNIILISFAAITKHMESLLANLKSTATV